MENQPTPPQPAPRPVYMSRAIDPVPPPVSPEAQARHEESLRLYPELNLSPAEYVISGVKRHPIGMLLPLGISSFCIVVIVSLTALYPMINASVGLVETRAYDLLILIAGLLSLLFVIGGYVAVWIYRQNRFFLTNESVIQEIQTSLFARREQTVSLANIEDASYHQSGIFQVMFDYGSIRLSTQGDETTYRFTYVINPRNQIALLNNAVEAFKNGRPMAD
jgi:uncharacterized membrane protein YdbT with pleckstrin-like domain